MNRSDMVAFLSSVDASHDEAPYVVYWSELYEVGHIRRKVWRWQVIHRDRQLMKSRRYTFSQESCLEDINAEVPHLTKQRY